MRYSNEKKIYDDFRYFSSAIQRIIASYDDTRRGPTYVSKLEFRFGICTIFYVPTNNRYLPTYLNRLNENYF